MRELNNNNNNNNNVNNNNIMNVYLSIDIYKYEKLYY